MDFLLNEAKFHATDIPKSLKIFNKSIDDLRARFVELSAIGAPIKVRALIITKTEYFKYAKLYCDDENEEHQSILLTIEKRLEESLRRKKVMS